MSIRTFSTAALFGGLLLGGALLAQTAAATEFYMGEPIVEDGMQFSPAYLTGIEMDRHPAGMSMDPKAIHIEIDIHAAKKEIHGFPEDAWIPYLTVTLTIEKKGGGYKETKVLAPMEADDGPHYANNFAMAGPGDYRATYVIDPPSSNGFLRHVDKATGVPDWWKPVTVSWDFKFPSKAKAD